MGLERFNTNSKNARKTIFCDIDGTLVKFPESFEGFKDLSEIAVGTGFGLRYDFDFFVFRLDTGFKTYDPSLPQSSRWQGEYAISDAVFNIGINYPF